MSGMDAGLSVLVLGPVEARRDGVRLEIGGGRQRALLAALALRPGEVVSSDRLIDELWGDAPPETAATSLHGLVSQLRKAIEPDRGHPTVLVTRPPGYVLELGPEGADAQRFARLVGEGDGALEGGQAAEARRAFGEALALWRGPALDGVADQPFARTEAHRLDELRLHAQEGRIEADLALGHAAAVVPELEALIEREPLRERPRAQLMRALYADGRQAAALEAYREARRTLHDELGIEPGPELRELERQILAQDPALGRPAPTSTPAQPRNRRRRRVIVLSAACVALAVVAAAAALLALRDGAPARVVVRPDSVASADLEARRFTGQVAVGSRPTAVAVGLGSVWVANTDDGTVTRIDPKTLATVKTYGIGAPASSLAIAGGAVWVGNGSAGTVSRIDAGPGGGVDTIDVSSGADELVRDTVYDVAAAAGSVWVAVGTAVLRLDEHTGERRAKIELGVVPLALAGRGGGLWAGLGDERLVRIEPSTGRIAGQAETSFPVDLAVGLGQAWLVTTRSELAVYSADTLEADGLFPLGDVFPTAIAVGEGVVWVAEVRPERPSLVVRLDPERPGEPTMSLPLGPHPADLAAGAGKVWVAARETGP